MFEVPKHASERRFGCRKKTRVRSSMLLSKKKHLHCAVLDIYATTKARVKIMFADMLSPKMTILDTLGKTEDDPTLSIPWTKYCKNLAFHIFSYAGCLWQWLFIFAPRRKSINFISKHFNGVAF